VTALVGAAEILGAVLEAAGAQRVAHPAPTAPSAALLLDLGARVVAIDPAPAADLVRLAGERDQLELVRGPATPALARTPLPDAVVIGSDAPPEVLEAVARRADALGLLVVAEASGGVRTALEDLGLELVVIPAFGGLGVAWPAAAAWAPAVRAVLERWRENALLERLEANRAFHLATVHEERRRAVAVAEREERRRALLERLHRSRGLAVAEAATRLVRRGRPAGFRAEIEELLRGRDG
jgi:hypothetical protein